MLSISIFGASSIIIAVFLTGKLSSAEVHPLFTLSVGDFIVSCTWLFGGAVWIHNKEKNAGNGLGLCYVLALATLIISMVTYLLTVVYAAHALIRMREIYKNRGRQSLDSHTKWWRHVLTALMYIICWSLPALLVLPVTESKVGLEISDDACWCFIDFFNTRPDNGLSNNHSDFDNLALIIAGFTGIWFALSTLIILVIYILTLYLAWKVLKFQQITIQQAEQRSVDVIKRLVARASAFIIIFFICGFPAFVASIVVWKERTALTVLEKPDLFVLYWQALIGPLQGFLNAIVYGWSRKEFRRAIQVPVRVRMKFTRGSQSRIETDRTGLINVRDSPTYT